MTTNCVSIEDIAEVIGLPDEDPRRMHLKECPRCRALVLEYRAFLESDPVTGSNPADAEARLGEFVQKMVGGGGPERTGSLRPKRFFSLPRFHLPAPARVAATVVVVAAAVLWWQPWVEETGVLRKTTTPSGVVALDPPQRLNNGSVRLSWQVVDGADAYQVRLYGSDLSEITRLEPVPGTSIDVPRSTFPQNETTTVVWRVFALKDGDEISASQPDFLDIPEE